MGGVFSLPIKWGSSNGPSPFADYHEGPMGSECESILETVKWVYYSKVSCTQEKLAICLSSFLQEVHSVRLQLDLGAQSPLEFCLSSHFLAILTSFQLCSKKGALHVEESWLQLAYLIPTQALGYPESFDPGEKRTVFYITLEEIMGKTKGASVGTCPSLNQLLWPMERNTLFGQKWVL